MPAWADLAPARLARASLAALALACAGPAVAQTSDLVATNAFRVCADPAADPMSMEDGSGYENKIAELFARELGRPLEYLWYPMSTGFVRNTLRANLCDVIIGYAQGDEMVQNTNHYLVSSYMLVVPQDSPLAAVEQLSDEALQGKRIGVVAGTPPATHMARHGLIGRAKPYPLFVDRRYQSPVTDMLNDLAAGDIDAAVVWGPLGGPLVRRDHPDFTMIPLIHEADAPRMFYRITMGVRPGDKNWEHELNSLIRRNQGEIDAILTEAGVPLLNDMGTAIKAETQ